MKYTEAAEMVLDAQRDVERATLAKRDAYLAHEAAIGVLQRAKDRLATANWHLEHAKRREEKESAV